MEEKRGWSCFVGDSSTDLLAALEVDVGILMAPRSSTIEVCGKIGIKLLPLPADLEEVQQLKNPTECTLFVALNWKDIQTFLRL
jgi:hypothetical protein